MNERRSLCTAACLALLAATLSGCASGGNPFKNTSDFDRTFIGAAQTWDLDKNGSVSCEEWVQYVSASVRENDTNGDGALDADEWKKLVRSDRLFEVANISYYDTNGDGRITAEEMTGKQNLAFKLLDRNTDCQIDRTETVQVHGIDKPKAADTGSSAGRGPGSGGAGGGGY
ncbi:MAG: EF-hand domain-containing protein [Hyphomicrobium sp.]